MSVARFERGNARGILILGIVVCAAGMAWLAQGLLQSSESGSTATSELAPAGSRSKTQAGAPAPALGADRRSGDPRTDAAPVPDPSSPPAPSDPDRPDPGWGACLDRPTPEEIRECLASGLDTRPDAMEIARFLCSDGRGLDLHAILVDEALYRIPAAEALAWINQLEVGCRRYLEWGLLEYALRVNRKRDAAWFQEFRATLTPERLFAPDAGQGGILLATLFIEDDPQVQNWIEMGARGEWGGTVEQIDRAIAVSLTIPRSGIERLVHLRSIIASAAVPGGGAVGSTFVHALLDPGAWPDGDSTTALDTLLLVLYEPRFRESAAATVCLNLPVEPPQGCDPAAWAAIRARSLEIASQIGLSIPTPR